MADEIFQNELIWKYMNVHWIGKNAELDLPNFQWKTIYSRLISKYGLLFKFRWASYGILTGKNNATPEKRTLRHFEGMQVLCPNVNSVHFYAVCTALTASCKLIGGDLVNALLPTVTELLGHPKEMVRKKAVMVLHRFLQLDPDQTGPLHDIDFSKLFRTALCDKVNSVTSRFNRIFRFRNKNI